MQIRIRSLIFTFPSPFAPGHVLNEAQAMALNSLFAENVRNNVDQWVRGDESPEEQASLQYRVAEYAEKYQFRGRPRPTSHSPLEKMAEQVLLEKLGEFYGTKEELARLLASPEITAQAQARLRQEESVAGDFLRGLPL